MKKNFCYSYKDFFIFVIVITMMALAVFSGCKKAEPTSLYDPNYAGKPQPVITTVSPAVARAGIEEVVINGNNFSATPSENFVYFDNIKAAILSATATQLKVLSPAIVKDSIRLKVAVFGAEKFSDIKYYKQISVVDEFGGLQSNEKPGGIACDTAGNVFASMAKNDLGDSIKMFTPGGKRTSFAPAVSGLDNWSALKVGPGEKLYACRNQRALYTISKNSEPALFAAVTGAKFFDLDFDKYGNIWTGGADTLVYHIKQDQTVQSYSIKDGKVIKSENVNFRTFRVYNDYLYFGGKVDSIEVVYRAPITPAGDLGVVEKYFDLSAQPGYGYNGPGVYAITFNSDGEMYLGTDGDDAILLIKPNKAVSVFYKGILFPMSSSFAWDKGSYLYVSRSGIIASRTIIRINTYKTSAPYYGRGDK